MGKKLFVGNLPFSMIQSSLSNLFSEAGIVQSVTVITDPTGAPKGYAFIEMSTPEEAQKAIAQFNGKELKGQRLTVNEVRPQERPKKF